MDQVLLDTSTLSEIRTQRNREVVRRANLYLRAKQRFEFSEITRYEVRRGYFSSEAWTALHRFDAFCLQCIIVSVTTEILDIAAELWGFAKRSGRPGGDADLIIAATALHLGMTLVTSNTRHFEWIDGLALTDWRVAS